MSDTPDGESFQKSMHIAIDARLNAYRQGGIPQYTRQLMTALAELARDDQITSLQHRAQLRPLAVAPNVVRRTILTPPHHRFEQWTLPLELLLVRPDVLHCPDFIAPMRRTFPAVVTIHDLAFKHYPEILDDAGRAYYGQIKTNVARADGIIAVSEATRQDIAQFLDIPIEDIAMIHEAAAPLYGRLDLRPGEARVLNATPVAAGTFMLFVSTLEPRKNLPTLLQALRICLDRQPGRRYLLVVAGARGWRDDQIFDTVRDLRLGNHVLFAGNVGQYDLRWLYNACRLYINPSLYEGFGLPLLEAMACGAPCLAAATSSLPEIGGEAAIYVPPLDAALWADAIEELWDDEERRHELGQRGRVQAQHFSWLRAARETLKVYERAIQRAQPAALPRQQRSTTALESHLAELGSTQTEAFGAVAGLSGDARPCLRCGTAMQAGQIQRSLAIKQPTLASDDSPLATRVWACPHCGHVELVVTQDDLTPALADEAVLPDAVPPAVAHEAAGDLEDAPALELLDPALEPPGAPLSSVGDLEDAPALELLDPTLEPAHALRSNGMFEELTALNCSAVGEPVEAARPDPSADSIEDSAAPLIEAVAPATTETTGELDAGADEDSTQAQPEETAGAAAQLDGESNQDQSFDGSLVPSAEVSPEAERPEIAASTIALNGTADSDHEHSNLPVAELTQPQIAAPAPTHADSSSTPPAKRRQSRSKRKRS